MQALLKSGMKAGGKRVVVAGTGPLLLAVAAGATKAGARVISVHEQATLGKLAGFGLQVALSAPGKLLEGAAYRWQTRSAGFRLGSWVVRAEGGERLEQVVVTDGSHEERIACDWLACGFHLVPNLELPQLLGCRVEGGFVAVDEMQQSSVAGVACVGELTGVGGLEKALVEGEIAGWAAAGRTDKVRALGARRRAGVRFAARLESAFALRPELRGLADRTTVVCRCEDVTHGALAECKSGREARLHTRCGMGACQARVCGSATEFLYGWQPTSGRPPVFPARVETLLGASAER
jgi:NADPH-dependent 2,4-dienoyl-CoA reductase/sulfur reductase-like enzyme